MLSKIKQKSWYYAALNTVIASAISLSLCLILAQLGAINDVAKLNTNSISFISGIGLITSLIGGLILDKLSGKRSRRLKWFINQPLMWQFLVFIFSAVLVLVFLSVLNGFIENDYLKIVIGTFNLVYSGFGILIVFLFFRMIFRK